MTRQRTAFDALAPDADKVGGVAAAPFVKLADPATVFLVRAERLTTLAAGNPLEGFMLFLSRLASAQHAARAAFPLPSVIDPERLALCAEGAMPPLSADLLRSGGGFTATLRCLLENTDMTDAPPEARAARDRLSSMDQADRIALAGDVFEAAYPADRLGESIYVAAALQVYLTRQAAVLDDASLQPIADGICPVCGQAPIASLVVGWTQASKARYLCCSMCSALWNCVRIKCTCCGSTDGVSYFTVEGGPEDVAVEACSTCHTYLKHLHQHRDHRLEPFADDVASYGLDLLVRDRFRRGGVNPLFVMG